MLSKLEHYGVRGETLHWIDGWLTARHQTVVVDGARSRIARVISGVPQGTVLGPLLCLLYINDIGDNIASPLKLFADDALLHHRVECPEDSVRLQDNLTKLVDWSTKWQMRFNPKKCSLLRVTRKRTPVESIYTMMGYRLEQVSHHPYLEFAKATRCLNFLWHNINSCPESLKETAYKTLVRSNTEYAAMVWDPYLQEDVACLEKFQRRAARFVKSDYGRESSVSGMLAELNWDTLQERRFVACQSQLWKTLRGNSAVVRPPHIMASTIPVRGQHGYALRNPSTTTDGYKYSFFPRTVTCWNLLLTDVLCGVAWDIPEQALGRD